MYRVSSVEFSLSAERQLPKKGVLVGFWGMGLVTFDSLPLDRSMHATYHAVSHVMGVLQSSQFWRIDISGPNLKAQFELVPTLVRMQYIIPAKR